MRSTLVAETPRQYVTKSSVDVITLTIITELVYSTTTPNQNRSNNTSSK